MISPVPVRSHTCCRLSIVHGIRLEGSLFSIRARAFARLSLLSRGSHPSISSFSHCSRCCQSDLVALSWVTAERLWVCISAYSACLAPRSLRVPPPHTHTCPPPRWSAQKPVRSPGTCRLLSGVSLDLHADGNLSSLSPLGVYVQPFTSHRIWRH